MFAAFQEYWTFLIVFVTVKVKPQEKVPASSLPVDHREEFGHEGPIEEGWFHMVSCHLHSLTFDIL